MEKLGDLVFFPMPDFFLRPMCRADLAAILAVQAQCYGHALIESAEALASRLALSPSTCHVACDAHGRLVAYLFTHPWPADSLPALDGTLQPPPASDLLWFVHDMAIAPAGRGRGVAASLFDAALEAARAAGLRRSRLIAVQSAADWWRRHGYAPAPADTAARHAAKLAAYGADAILMERELG